MSPKSVLTLFLAAAVLVARIVLGAMEYLAFLATCALTVPALLSLRRAARQARRESASVEFSVELPFHVRASRGGTVRVVARMDARLTDAGELERTIALTGPRGPVTVAGNDYLVDGERCAPASTLDRWPTVQAQLEMLARAESIRRG